MAEQDTFIPVPGGECRSENPNGISQTEGFASHHNLLDSTDQPKIVSGDWQQRPVYRDLKPRGRP